MADPASGSRSSRLPLRLGQYRLCRQIAAGGMGTVYLARVERPGSAPHFVALKRLHRHLIQDPGFVEMFFDEAYIASQIHHPNVCAVLDFETAIERHYLAMEYLMGEPLSQLRKLLACGPAPTDAPERRAVFAARIAADACEGLHAAHELCDLAGQSLGVVHRDVSAENIFITYDGTVKIVDFGVACVLGQRHHSVAGVVKGKLAYMPPEVLRGRRPDRRGDVWALGVVLWELLTLHRLFRRPTDLETCRAVERAEVVPPSAACAGVPPDLDPIVLRALAADPEARYPTTREFGRDLGRALVRLGAAVGAAEIAEWMDEVFPGGRERQRLLLEESARVADAPVEEGIEMATPPSSLIESTEPELELEALSQPTIDLGSADLRLAARGRRARAALRIGALAALVLGVAGFGFSVGARRAAVQLGASGLAAVAAPASAPEAISAAAEVKNQAAAPPRCALELRANDRRYLLLDFCGAVAGR